MKFFILAITFVSTLAFASVLPAQHSEKPSAKKHAIKKPTAKKVSVKKPIAKKPVAKKVVAQKPAVKKQIPTPYYSIDAIVSLDGVKSRPKFKLLEGATAEATQNSDLYTEVTVSKQVIDGKPGALMEFVIGKKDAVGNKSVIATPKILANIGEKSSIMIGDKKLIVSATATKVAR